MKTYFAVATALTMLFAAYYSEGIPFGAEYKATPHNLVRPAIGGLAWSAIGAIAGWMISAIVKSFKRLPHSVAKAS